MQEKPSFLPNLSVQRPVTIVVSLLAIIVLGLIAYKNIPIELLPSGFNPPFLGVWVSYPNANPQEVEEQIARPVEEQVRTISGVNKVETYSNNNGCWTWLEFNSGTDMDVAYDQLRDRMERTRAYLPDDFERGVFVQIARAFRGGPDMAMGAGLVTSVAEIDLYGLYGDLLYVLIFPED